MKNMVASALFVMVLAVLPVYAQSTMPLQETCAEGAKKLIKGATDVTTSTSHYNKKLDKCFMRVGFYFAQIEEDVKVGDRNITVKHPHWMVSLYNVFDSKVIGNCAYIGGAKQECWVKNTKCKSIDEFDNLIRPYMEE